MKYLVLVGDGMADEPLAELDGRTPLAVAHTPNMDRLAREGELGLAQTVPSGFPPGSDVANLSLFGYDPAAYYSGRSPLEAASMRVELAPGDVAFRMNLVHLERRDGELCMADFSAGHIGTDEAGELVRQLQQQLGGDRFTFHPGISYRHLLVWHDGVEQLALTPPHDITDRPIAPHLPADAAAAPLLELMRRCQALLDAHPVNRRRREAGKAPANSAWFWGQGRAPQMPTLGERFGLTGAVISAVDLIKGIGLYAGLEVINVPGATGWIDTNYRGKAEHALAALRTLDYVYVHVEAPDEAAHAGLLREKVTAIEAFDREVVGTVLAGLAELGPVRLLVLPDHPTPLRLRTHTTEPVPYILWDSAGAFGPTASVEGYTEADAAKGARMPAAHRLLERMVSG